MAPWYILLVFVATANAATNSTNSTSSTVKREALSADSQGAGSGFFPQYNGFPSFPIQSPGVLPQHDLTALQQTHVLGEFQHRFNQQRPPFQNQQLLFNQQTEFGQPQQTNSFQPPRQPPAQEPPRPVTFPQQNSFRNFPPPPPSPPQKPGFPQQQFSENRPNVGEQRNEFAEPPRETLATFAPQPQQFFNQQPPSFQEPSFRPQTTFRQPNFQPINQNTPNSQFQGPTSSNPPAIDSSRRNPSFNNQFFDNRNPQANFEQPIRGTQNGNQQQFSEQRNPSFIPQPQSPPFLENNQFARNPSSQQNPRFSENFPGSQQQSPQLPASTFSQQPDNQFSNQPLNNPPRFGNGQFPSRPNIQQQSPSQPPFNPNYQPTFNPDSSKYDQTFSPEKPEQPNAPVSFNPNRKPVVLPTEFPKSTSDEYNSLSNNRPRIPQENSKRPLLPLLPTDLPSFSNGPPTKEDFFVQKSQEQNYFQKSTQFETQPAINEIVSNYQDQASTPVPIKLRTPPPTVKEITINLATTPAPSESSEMKEKSYTSNERTQEDIINEQIQKLLNGHNLELVNKGGKSEEAGFPLPNLPDHLKDKYQIKLVNSDLLSEIKGLHKKAEAPITTTAPTPPPLPPLPDLPDHIKKQYDIKLVQKDELFKQFKIGTGGKIVTNADLVAPLPGNTQNGNESTSVFLANGQQLEIVRFPKGGEDVKDSLAKATTKLTTPSITTTTTTSKPPKELFDELAKGVIPPGANFELIKHNSNGGVEKVKDLTAAKKVTFVLLEEQPDGSVRVQGVKGNTGAEKSEKESVDSILKKLKDGSLKLPPSQSILTNEIPKRTTTFHKSFVTVSPKESDESYTTETYFTPESTFKPYQSSFSGEVGIFTPAPASDETTFVTTAPTFLSSLRPKSKSRPNFLPTPSYNFDSTTKRPKNGKRPLRRKPTTTTSTTEQYDYDEEDYNQRSSNYNGEGPIPQDVLGQESNPQPSHSLTSILQNYGLYEMAKFLDQSGLDTILNETGPYTIFIPTDAAFANLQEQLGGTDKAEDKFKENPRLLSGLLLHHVVPGSFKVSDLQDEMTGVSLAGTQLRVNTYNAERKDSVVTVNGAVVSGNKRDIPVPQGIAHAVDRVLFPLPVGDLIQTLKGDRERRFNKFVKSIEASGLIDMLTGSKTYTVFAPTDKAFSALTDSELDKLLTRREAARTIVLRHIMPGTLYSAGMHFYQIKDSMERGQKITIKKELGKVKANSAQVVTTNIPATNGVVHVIDTLL